MDCVNALLSFGYSLLTADCQPAIEAVGLDGYVGFFTLIVLGEQD